MTLDIDKKCFSHRRSETALLYAIFLAAFQSDFPKVENLLSSSTLTSRTYLRPLVEISMETGDAQLLQLCFDIGYMPSGINESNQILSCRTKNAPSTEWLHVLYDFDFRQWRTDRSQLNRWETWHYVLNMGPNCVRWWIDHGGSTPCARDLFWEYSPGWPGATAFQILLDRFGVDWFTNSGTLQLAAKKEDFETVRMLIEAGADVNENVEDWQLDIREHRRAPLPALKEAMYAKSEEMIRYLVDHGAKLPRKDINKPYDQTPQDVKVFRNLIVELGGVEQND